MVENPLAIKSAPHEHREQTGQDVCREWYHQYGARIYGYLRFHLPSPELAEDLTSEVFLRALKSFRRFDVSAGTPRAWLFRIAQNALRDHRRQATRRLMLPITGMWDLECGAPSQEERVLWEEEIAELLSAMSELPPADREVIGLCYGSELPIAEAAEILKLSSAATRTRLWRALGRLRKILLR